MGDYSVPEEIRKLKPVGTIIKVVKGKYYVYSHTQHKDPDTGKWKTDPGKILGRIVDGVGYIPNEDVSRKKGITCFDYGSYLLCCSLGKDDFNLLKEYFNAEEAMQLFSYAVIIAVKGYTGISDAPNYYERSLIAHDYPQLKFSYRRLSSLLEIIGRQDTARRFQQKCIENSGSELAVDGHVIAASSENNELASPGYKTKTIKSSQMNLMVALDVKTAAPVATKFYPGYMLDKSDFRDFIEHCGSVKGKIILIDRGFFSEENMNLIDKEGAFYVIPLSENQCDYKYVIKDVTSFRGGDKLEGYFLYHKGKNNDIVRYKTFTINGRKVIYYKNTSEAERLSRKYLEEIENETKGYTIEKYNEIASSFGVIVLTTNLTGEKEDEKRIYERYKGRWSIETYYDRLKNVTGFKELNIDDYGTMQGLAFVMLLVGRIEAEISEAAREVKLSKKNLLSLCAFLKLADVDGRITIHNLKSQHDVVFEKLGISMDTTSRCLSS